MTRRHPAHVKHVGCHVRPIALIPPVHAVDRSHPGQCPGGTDRTGTGEGGTKDAPGAGGGAGAAAGAGRVLRPAFSGSRSIRSPRTLPRVRAIDRVDGRDQRDGADVAPDVFHVRGVSPRHRGAFVRDARRRRVSQIVFPRVVPPEVRRVRRLHPRGPVGIGEVSHAPVLGRRVLSDARRRRHASMRRLRSFGTPRNVGESIRRAAGRQSAVHRVRVHGGHRQRLGRAAAVRRRVPLLREQRHAAAAAATAAAFSPARDAQRRGRRRGVASRPNRAHARSVHVPGAPHPNRGARAERERREGI
mmetsp:Transcript_14803/g.53222  ORF Transcript_14803/g.53222 Transcript_14803/m.53222 type:complete len:303 (+) Transcript_14803:1198-2106(+)